MKISGKVRANPSKSYMQRALVLAALSDSPSTIFNPSIDSDSLFALSLIEKFNCKIKKHPNLITIIPSKISYVEKKILNCGESGLLMRMIAPVLSLFDNEFTLTAEGSLMKRELFEVVEVLKSLGAKVETNNNFPPIKIKGPIHSSEINLLADKTSQFLTGLLISLPTLKEKSIIKVENLSSKPYIDITIELVRQFGGKVGWINDKVIEINPSHYVGQNLIIEGDWSSSAVLLIAGAIAGEVTVSGLNLNSKQGDKSILDILEKVGAKIELSFLRMQESNLEHPLTPSFQEEEFGSVTVKKHDLKPFEYDARDTPDLVPYLAILAANCKGKSVIHNVGRLNLKESRRLELIMNNLSMSGIKNELENDALLIWGGKISGGIFETRNDHRMAMAGALASLTSEKAVSIDNTDCVRKSYPNFWEDFKTINSKF